MRSGLRRLGDLPIVRSREKKKNMSVWNFGSGGKVSKSATSRSISSRAGQARRTQRDQNKERPSVTTSRPTFSFDPGALRRDRLHKQTTLARLHALYPLQPSIQLHPTAGIAWDSIASTSSSELPPAYGGSMSCGFNIPLSGRCGILM